MANKISLRQIVPYTVLGIVLVAGTSLAMRSLERWEAPVRAVDQPGTDDPLVSLAAGHTDTLQFAPEALSKLGYRLATVEPAPPPPPLSLQGHIDLDPDARVRIKPRFTGKIAQIAEFEDPAAPANAPKRTLRLGDRVHKGQILAVLWSTEIGEQKSKLVDGLSKLHTAADIFDRLEKAEAGAIPKRTIIDARRDYEEALVAVEDARRTLVSWSLSADEIDAVYREAAKLQERKPQEAARQPLVAPKDNAIERGWANTDLRSPIDGVILEKNFNFGDQVDPSDDLFQIADPTHVRVLARVYEDDLPTLRTLPPEKRHWKIDLKADPFDEPVPGTFELIGAIIDPTDHTGTVMGTLDNSGGRMSLGQFVTATIDLDADPNMVAVPAKAVNEDPEHGSLAAVFVQDNIHPNEFTRRLVAIASRIPGRVCIRSEPNEAERAAGAKSLKVGERVLASGVLELNAELAVLKAAQPEVQARVHIP